jgi:hypothetical protein
VVEKTKDGCVVHATDLPKELHNQKPKEVRFLKTKLNGEDRIVLQVNSDKEEIMYFNMKSKCEHILTYFPVLKDAVFVIKE